VRSEARCAGAGGSSREVFVFVQLSRAERRGVDVGSDEVAFAADVRIIARTLLRLRRASVQCDGGGEREQLQGEREEARDHWDVQAAALATLQFPFTIDDAHAAQRCRQTRATKRKGRGDWKALAGTRKRRLPLTGCISAHDSLRNLTRDESSSSWMEDSSDDSTQRSFSFGFRLLLLQLLAVPPPRRQLVIATTHIHTSIAASGDNF